MVPSLNNTALIFPEIFVIECCTVLVEPTYDVITFLICIIQKPEYLENKYYHLRSTVKHERFFHGGLLFKRDSFPDNCIHWTNENVSFGARNYECLSQKCSTFWSRVVQV